MNLSKKTLVVVVIALVCTVGIGIAIGTSLRPKEFVEPKGIPPLAVPSAFADQSKEELIAKLNTIMLPKEEFAKFEEAILQTAMSFLMSQASGSTVAAISNARQELKENIKEKFGHAAFANMNARSMEVLSKDELGSVLTFCNSTAGAKILNLPLKWVQSIASHQTNLSSWLPKTLNDSLAKLHNRREKDQQGTPQNPDVEDVEDEENMPRPQNSI